MVKNEDWESAQKYDGWTWGTVYYERGNQHREVTGYVVVAGLPNSKKPTNYIVQCATKEKTHKFPLNKIEEIEEKPKD